MSSPAISSIQSQIEASAIAVATLRQAGVEPLRCEQDPTSISAVIEVRADQAEAAAANFPGWPSSTVLEETQVGALIGIRLNGCLVFWRRWPATNQTH